MKMQKPKIDLEKVKQGDPDAFRDFFAFLYPKLKALACRFVDEETAEDLTQDVFTSYWERKHLIQADNIYSFLFKWLQNDCLNRLRHQTVVEAYEERMRLAEARKTYWDRQLEMSDQLRRLIDKDLLETIEQSVNQLPPKCAEAFRLCYYRNMSHKEVAARMQISPRTVEGHIHAALTFLRNKLRHVPTMLFMFYNMF